MAAEASGELHMELLDRLTNNRRAEIVSVRFDGTHDQNGQ